MSTLTSLREELRVEGRESEEDAVLELMDLAAGWSAPHMKL